MPRPPTVPAYCLHKPSGLARVILDGRQIYLGRYGSPESQEAYVRLIAARFRPGANDSTSKAPVAHAPATGYCTDGDLSINELVLHYLRFAQAYYVRDGEPTGELHNVKDALRTLRTLYGTCRAASSRKFRTRSRSGVVFG